MHFFLIGCKIYIIGSDDCWFNFDYVQTPHARQRQANFASALT